MLLTLKKTNRTHYGPKRAFHDICKFAGMVQRLLECPCAFSWMAGVAFSLHDLQIPGGVWEPRPSGERSRSFSAYKNFTGDFLAGL